MAQPIVDADTLDALVPALILQLLVENAIKYGVAPHGRARFQGALSRVRHQIDSEESGALGKKLLALVRGMHTDTPTDAVPPAQRNGTKLTLSRGYREKLQDRLGRPL